MFRDLFGKGFLQTERRMLAKDIFRLCIFLGIFLLICLSFVYFFFVAFGVLLIIVGIFLCFWEDHILAAVCLIIIGLFAVFFH